MKKKDDNKRLFLGMEVKAPWPSKCAGGRIICETSRHITLVFFGNTSFSHLYSIIHKLPKPQFKIGLAGYVDKFLFLPENKPRVVAYHIKLFENNSLQFFQKSSIKWFEKHKYNFNNNTFLPHVTIARQPFSIQQWTNHFQQLPVIITKIHLYESLGNLTYESKWDYPLHPPFEEIEHTSDIAFCIYGETLSNLHINAQTALTFLYPDLIPYVSQEFSNTSLDDIIIDLNQVIANADQHINCPIKAISFHGNLEKHVDKILKWEMIIDV